MVLEQIGDGQSVSIAKVRRIVCMPCRMPAGHDSGSAWGAGHGAKVMLHEARFPLPSGPGWGSWHRVAHAYQVGIAEIIRQIEDDVGLRRGDLAESK